ncbi:ABC transporter permease [Paenibacillus sacheonensis]|uniref:ABC transporter permease subunit n=1 Tax=Paenibacillus sacheonensis TaxID=742054 RepID=A0A7X4YUI0_9BACL|nr:ABC transporter permease subunit [Paenibacillus sacheonensis]MBM7567260.1 putative aldouronate transport system permease protein [Paenibacillus sacheonensis]NBC72845.1 ABC transporter permease subunit [Paenibacillus sacheonensis]
MGKKNWRLERPLHLMILPGLLFVLIFSYAPMAGLIIAFQDFIPTKGMFGSHWVGLEHFKYVYGLPQTRAVVANTLFISFMKIVAGLVVPITTAILLNEIRKQFFKRAIQTVIYLPHFLSWVILSGILIDILSPSSGILNQGLGFLFGAKPIFFLGDQSWFPYVMVTTDVWKEFGFGTIIYLAALTSINPMLYEAAVIDGANRWKQTLHITIPGMFPVIVLMMTLAIGNILNAGFDQIFNMYNPSVYETGDILDTYVYRLAFVNAQLSVATAVGLFKSIISFLLISLSYIIAYRFANYRIF